MITLTILEKEIRLPENVNEFLWRDYKNLIDKEKELKHGLDPIHFFSLITGIEEKEVRSLNGDDSMLQIILWYHKNIYREIASIKTPDQKDMTKIMYDGKGYKPLKQLEWKTTGQFQDALQVANEMHPDIDDQTFMQIIERIFMIYFYPIVFEDEYKAENIHKLDAGLVRAIDVRTFGDFFLRKLIGYYPGIKKNVPIKDLLRKNPLLALTK